MNELEIRSDDATAIVVPERGGMIVRWVVDGRDVLYLDRSTLEDPTKNVRGGVPLLFPSPGKLESDAWAHGTLKQHGFARNLAWTIVGRAESEVTLRLESSEATRIAYPFAFSIDVRYALARRTLTIEARVVCRGPTAMPFGFGTHPYFALDAPGAFTITSPATRAFDNVARREVAFDARELVLGEREIDLHLVDHAASSIDFATDHARVVLDAPEHRRWVIWSPPGKPFVCVEPWTCPGNALNTGIDLLTLARDETRTLTQTFRVA
jgi:galactose mutarotase-like enzyme